FARRGRVDAQETVGVRCHPGAAGGGVGFALDDGEQVAIFQVEKALLVGRISLESDLEIAPVDVDRRHFALSPAPPPKEVARQSTGISLSFAFRLCNGRGPDA